MAHVISKPVDALIQEAIEKEPDIHSGDRVISTADVVIVGSGYGGSVAAAKISGLCRQGKSGESIDVLVLERGREYSVGDFPNNLSDLPRFVRFRRPSDLHPTGYPDALFDLRLGDDVDVLVGSGLGGGSLINANVAARPCPSVLDDRWPDRYRNGGLDDAFLEIENLLGAGPSPATFTKLEALEKLGEALGKKACPGAKTDLARITVTQDPDGTPPPNAIGIRQPNCTNCGNCVTGCNVGSKNTLMMNLIPLARSRDARFVTGANVLTLEPIASDDKKKEPGQPGWRLRLQRTESIKTPLETECWLVEARYVILAAGALGSTEILKRSEALSKSEDTGLAFSGHLGGRFSTNGDAVVFSYGQRERVNALGTTKIWSGKGPGPTITGMVRDRVKDDKGTPHPFTLEDASIPASLIKLFGEASTTGAALGRIGNNKLPAWLKTKDAVDPLAYNEEILDHGQALLIMSDDGASRRLSFSNIPNAGHPGHVDELMHQQVVVSELGADDRSATAGWNALDRVLSEQSVKDGLDGGQYVPNPLWRLLPPEARDVLSGTIPGGRNVSVHPLGGCCMGSGPYGGVVDENCQVFKRPDEVKLQNGRAHPDEVHDGLYVMDGSVIPGPLATNPFLTIAAVAWEATDTLIEEQLKHDGWERPESSEPREPQVDPDLVHFPEPGAYDMAEAAGRTDSDDGDDPEKANLIISEQMLGQILDDDLDLVRQVAAMVPAPPEEADRAPDAPRPKDGSRFFGHQGMVLRFELAPIDVHRDFGSFGKCGVTIQAKAHLYANPEDEEQARRRRSYGTPRGLSTVDPLASGTAEITLMEPDAPCWAGSRWARAFTALVAYAARRKGRFREEGEGWVRAAFRLPKRFPRFWKLAKMHAQYRQFHYNVCLETPSGTKIRFDAKKKIRWALGQRRLWDSLLNLPVKTMTLTSASGETVKVPAHFEVDAAYMLDHGVQADRSSMDMVESTMSVLGLASWFVRCFLQTSFWEFGAPEYDRDEPDPDLDPPALRVGDSGTVDPVCMALPVDDENLGSLMLELVRYRQPSVDSEKPPDPVLLIHGLAQGSGIYNNRHMRRNMASYLWDEGYDVWLLDYRLSNRLDVPFNDFIIEAMGEHDIPAAVRAIYDEVGRRPVKVFAHCVGAAAVQIAILRGRLKSAAGDDMVESVCFNAIHPWVLPSPANRVRLKLGTFARNWISDEILDPVVKPSDRESQLRSMIDRLAFSFSRIAERHATGDERHRKGWPGLATIRSWLQRLVNLEEDTGTCDRMTLFYGRMWQHDNIELALRANWDELVGPAPDEVYEHLYYLIERERLLDDKGENTLLTEKNLLEHWCDIPTFFLHGDESDVFNPQSATRSAVRLNLIFRGEERRASGARLAPVYLRRAPGYGHMDPILARDAHERAYPYVSEFFRLGKEWRAGAALLRPREDCTFDEIEPDHDPEREARDKPAAGLVLRAAWIGDDETIVTRYWVEKYRFNTSRVVGLVPDAVGWCEGRVHDLITLPDCPDRFVWADYATDPKDYRLPEAAFGEIEEWPQCDMLMVRPAVREASTGSEPAAPTAARELDLSDAEVLRRFASPSLVAEDLASMIDLDMPETGEGMRSPTNAPPPTPVLTNSQPPWYRRLVRRIQNDDDYWHNTFNFLVGSCRYPGMPMERKNADAVFRAMLERASLPRADAVEALDDRDALDMTFFLGDQIYADATADIFDSEIWEERYLRAYQEAFTSENMAKLLKSIPIHFAIDDHEIVDDYSGGAAKSSTVSSAARRGAHGLSYATADGSQIEAARLGALSYMSSARERRHVGKAPTPPRGSLWYELDEEREANFPCFVLDTRTQRELRQAQRHSLPGSYPSMLGEKQKKDLFSWLKRAHDAHRDRPKFIFAGQIIAPVTKELISHRTLFREEDGFFGYPETLRALARHLVEHQIKNVVFVGGDLHFSCAARIELEVTDPGSGHLGGVAASGVNESEGEDAPVEGSVTIWQIVSSGLYAPLPFANRHPTEYTWMRDRQGKQNPRLVHSVTDVDVTYQAEWLTNAPAHFLEVLVKESDDSGQPRWLVDIAAYDASNHRLSSDRGVFDCSADDIRMRFSP